MANQRIIDAIKGNLQSFDRLKDAYLENGSIGNLKNCVGVLLAIDALISKAEFEEIEGIRAKEKELLRMADKIGFKRLMEILEKILAMEQKMKDIVRTEGLSVSRLDKRSFFERYSEPDRRDIINRVLKKISQEPELNKENVPVDYIVEIIEITYINFVSLYDLKKEFIAKIRDFTDIPMGGEEMALARKELSIRFEDYEKQLSDEITFAIAVTMNAIHTLEYFRRFEAVKSDLHYAFHKSNVKSFKKFVISVLKDRYRKPIPLGINYKKPSETFHNEAQGLRGYFNVGTQFDEVMKLLIYFIDFVTHLYSQRVDSIYHQIEHTAQNLITGVRIFKAYAPIPAQKKLNLQKFFILCCASSFHDYGYSYRNFSRLNTSFLSSMHHVGHELRSAQFARRFLSHFKDQIMKIFPEINFDEFLASVSNVILATELFGHDADEKKDADLLMIIRAADLLEMCSENYVGWLLSLFVEFKIGDPGEWEISFMKFLQDSIPFMTAFPITKQRVDDAHIMEYLENYKDSAGRSVYDYNRMANIEVIRELCNAFENEQSQLELKFKRIAEAA